MNNSLNILDKAKITAPKGFEAAGIHCGIKKQKKDLAMIYSKVPTLHSAVYTKNLVKAAPLLWCQELTKNKSKIQAIVINSGNANACTGERGYQDVIKTIETASEALNIDKNSVMTTSTGVIGVYLPMENLVCGVKEISTVLSDDDKSAKDCAQAIMTTDTFEKEAAVELELGGKIVTIAGIAKGSGMIHPNMATMLNFITTDVNITQEMLDKAFKSNIDDTFNMITVDGETSTNDMAVILANGMAENPLIDSENEDFYKFKNALFYITKELAKDIVKDGEGASKFLECTILNVSDKEKGRVLCKAILNSSLVKTAFFGRDANWGRVLSAMGAAGESFNPDLVQIKFKSNAGEILLYEKGAPVEFDEDYALKILSEKEIKILIDMNEGEEKITGWGCDLTYDYVKINAEYRS